jgi:hypothetical protein
MNEPTPEQYEQIKQGCFYELCRILATALCACTLYYLFPLFGIEVASLFIWITMWIGLFSISKFIMSFVYPDRPLENIKKEIERE